MNSTDQQAGVEEASFASGSARPRHFEAAGDGWLVLEAGTGQIRGVNSTLTEMTGLPAGELLGVPVWEATPFRNLIPDRASFDALQRQGGMRHEHLPLVSGDGRKTAVEFFCAVCWLEDGPAVQCQVRDITARKLAEEELRRRNAELEQRIAVHQQLEAKFIEAQKMDVIGQLASGVAHDFNNLLAVIMGYTDLLASDLGAESPLRKYTEEIRRASECAAGLANQLLIFGRKHTVQPTVLDLNVVVNDLAKMLRRLIGETIELVIVAEKDLGHVKADAGQVCQVLMNLVVNARDAMPNGGRLTIATANVSTAESGVPPGAGEAPAGYARLTVTDTGTGMTSEVKARLFEAFFTTKPVGKGTGLGLATCQKIVRQSGGHISVWSEFGEGASFHVYFPRVGQPVAAASPVASVMPDRGTETLLLVEDEPAVRHMACGVLEALGYRVLSAANGQDALNVARDHDGPPIQLVVTDVIMPVMGGKLMAEWLQTAYPDLKILFTSGYTDDIITHHGVQKSKAEFLPKPYTTAALAGKVREILDAA